jgi:hypothetical protein
MTRLDHRSNTGIVDFVQVRMSTRMVGVAMRHTLTRSNVGVLVLIASIVVIFVVIFLARDSSNNFELAAENHGESVASNWLFDSRDTGAVAPFVDLTAKGVCFMFEHAELAGGEHSVTTRGMNVSNRGVDDRRLGGTTDLGKIWQESGKVLTTLLSSG